MKSPILRTLWCGAALCLATVAGTAIGQPTGFPNKPITIVVPYAAGGTTDVLGRQVAEILRREGGQPVVVENRTGASGSLAGRHVINASADGYTLLMTSSGIHAVTPVVHKDFKPAEGLTQVIILADVPFVLAVHKDFPAQNLADFLGRAKLPSGVRIATVGQGSHGHLTQIMFARATGIETVPVPYRGSTPAITDLLGAQIDATIDNAGVLKPMIDAGRLKAIFISSQQRSPALPSVPTAIEQGVNFQSMAWFGVAAPRGIPPRVVQQLRDMIARGYSDKGQNDRLVQAGLIPVMSTVAEANVRADQDVRTLGPLAASLNLSGN
jgi:tripartite-type tricarboxylate transporter receptor subunit TctC